MSPSGAKTKTTTQDGRGCIICDERRSILLPLLQQAQDEKGYISDEDMQNIAEKLDIRPVEVYSAVTFYSFLTTQKKGKYVIRVSNCVAAWMKGADEIVKAFEEKLGIKEGETTEDGLFTLERTACIGMCDHAPAIMLNDKLIGDLTPQKVEEIIAELKK